MAFLPLAAGTIDFPTYTVTTPGTAQQFSNIQIPDGFKVTFKNRLSNAGNFYLANSAADAISSTGDRKTLEPGESVTLEIGNLNLLFRDADNSTDRLEVTLLQATVI